MWVTRQQNVDFVPKHHRTVSKKTYGNGRKLSDTKWSHLYPSVKELLDSGISSNDISESLNIPKDTLHSIIQAIKRRNN
jgi:hypothetical protein